MNLPEFKTVSQVFESSKKHLNQLFEKMTPVYPNMNVNDDVDKVFANLQELCNIALQSPDGPDLIVDHNNIMHTINAQLTSDDALNSEWPIDFIYQAAHVQEAARHIMIAAIDITHKHNGDINKLYTAAIQTAAMCIRLVMNLQP